MRKAAISGWDNVFGRGRGAPEGGGRIEESLNAFGEISMQEVGRMGEEKRSIK